MDTPLYHDCYADRISVNGMARLGRQRWRLWVATAFYAGHLRRFDQRPAVEGRGVSEVEALGELAEALGTH